jgi:hypothetical protein
MLNLFPLTSLQSKVKKFAIYLQVAVLTAAGLAPLAVTGTADAAQLTTRSVTISTSEASATGVEYAFAFTVPAQTPVQGIIFEFCEDPLGTCVLPAGMSVNRSVAGVSPTQTFTELTAFTEYGGADLGDCDDSDGGAASTQYCVSRTDTDPEDDDGKAITLTGIVNPSIPSGNNATVYIRVLLYSDASFATQVHEGAVAASVNEQLTVNGRVQERLLFCVAALDDGGAGDGGMPADMAACSAESETVVDLGIIDNSSIARSPVANNPPSSQGNDRYGIAMVNTNASNGVSITYFAEPDGTGTQQLRSFRVPGATCDVLADDEFDQCFTPAEYTDAMTAGTESFGLNVPCIVADGATQNIVVDTAYENDGTTTYSADCENTEADYFYNWNTSSTADVIATSPSAVDDEMLKLGFAATAAATTPTGLYTVTSTYIATPTF